LNRLIEILRIETNEINASFEKASIEGRGTSQEVADRREQSFVNKFLMKYFPFPYRVVKGNIIDSFGQSSQSIDCVIMSPSHPHTVDISHDHASVMLADGIDLVVEVKPDISSFDELKRGLRQIQSVKKLRRVRTSHISGIGKKYTTKQLEVFKQIPRFIFANKGPKDIKLLIKKIYEFYKEEEIPLNEQFDYIVVNGHYLIVNSAETICSFIGDTNGICFAESGSDTLALFLYYLNMVPHSEIQLSISIIPLYIKLDEIIEGYKTFIDLNSEYRGGL